MLSKKKKIIILVVMVALLVVTGYLNIALNNNVENATTANAQKVDFYTGYRADRQSSREAAILFYEGIIASKSSSEEAKKIAEASKQELIEAIEKEFATEKLIEAAGFSDVVLNTTSENVNVIIKASELTESEVATIAKIVVEQTGKSLENIKIIPSS